MTISIAHLQPIVALIAGILILIIPRLYRRRLPDPDRSARTGAFPLTEIPNSTLARSYLAVLFRASSHQCCLTYG